MKTYGSGQTDGAPLTLSRSETVVHESPSGSSTPNLIRIFAGNFLDRSINRTVTIRLYNDSQELVGTMFQVLPIAGVVEVLTTAGSPLVLNGSVVITASVDEGEVLLWSVVDDQALEGGGGDPVAMGGDISGSSNNATVESLAGGSILAEDVLTNVPAGACVYVDAVSGDDDTAVAGDASRPFETLDAAIAVLTAGACLILRPGAYTAASAIHHSSGGSVLAIGNVTVTQSGAAKLVNVAPGITCTFAGAGLVLNGEIANQGTCGLHFRSASSATKTVTCAAGTLTSSVFDITSTANVAVDITGGRVVLIGARVSSTGTGFAAASVGAAGVLDARNCAFVGEGTAVNCITGTGVAKFRSPCSANLVAAVGLTQQIFSLTVDSNVD